MLLILYLYTALYYQLISMVVCISSDWGKYIALIQPQVCTKYTLNHLVAPHLSTKCVT